MQGILLQIRYFERELLKPFKKITLFFFQTTQVHETIIAIIYLSMYSCITRMYIVFHSYVLVCHPYTTRMNSYVTRLWFYHESIKNRIIKFRF